MSYWDWIPSGASMRYRLLQRLEAGDRPLSEINRIELANDYLVSCYLYYELDAPVISDIVFDAVCKELLDDYDMLMIVGVQHVGVTIDKECLAAGTAPPKYPEATKRIAIHINDMLQMGLTP